MNKVIREMVEITENKWVRVAIVVNLAVLTLRGLRRARNGLLLRTLQRSCALANRSE